MAGNKETSIGIKLVADIRNYQTGLSKAQSANRAFQKSNSQLKDSITSLLPVLSLAGIVAGATKLVTSIVSVRQEFEKYEAVLTNTLGSSEQAKEAMADLQKFASETPFALTELTGAFVKLTNYGLKPSMKEMTSYGDLAASVGKGFDQFAEALADAVTGEFERLKEFGIKSRKEGDKITFTFKEQATVVQNNATAIKEYITGLGNLKGVAGSMAAIAETLGGKISNLGDSWDGLMNTMGEQSSGIMSDTITFFNDLTKGADNFLKKINDLNNAGSDTTNSFLIMLGVRLGLIKQSTVDARLELDKLKSANTEDVESVAPDFSKSGSTIVKVDNTIGGLSEKLKELNTQLEATDVSDTKAISTIYAKIIALEKQKVALENIKKIIEAGPRDNTSMSPITNQKSVTQLSTTAPNTGTLDGVGSSIDANTERLQRFKDELADTSQQTENINSLAYSFGSLGSAIGGAAGSFMDMVSTILNLIPQLLTQIAALTTAQVASSQSVTIAKGGEAIASGTAASQSVPFPFNLIALAATIGSIIAALATKPKGYAMGGVVPGNNIVGDKVLARVNSGEEIITKYDPRHRNNMGRSGTGGGTSISIINQAKVSGEDLLILMKKAEKRVYRRT